MGFNFKESAKRHMDDAVLLESESRNMNADHHYGYAAESALAAILNHFSAFPKDENGDIIPPNHLKKHINELWPLFDKQLPSGRISAKARIGRNNPFSDWNVVQRYWCNSSQVNLEQHKRGAKHVMAILTRIVS